MYSYRVVWEIDIDAETPREAALKAQQIQRDPSSTANVFHVRPAADTSWDFDLDDGYTEEV